MNTPLTDGGSRSDRTPEPSLGVNDQLVFSTGNWYAEISTDAGATHSFVDPYTVFPASNGGFCCDQVAIYEPSRDLLIWVLQYSPDSNGNILRMAVTKGINDQTNMNWTYWDLSPQQLGYPVGHQFDFNDINFENNDLYLTTNDRDGGNSFVAGVIEQFSLDTIASLPGSLPYTFWTDGSVGAWRTTQNCSTTMYFGSHTASNNVRIGRIAESDNTLYYDDVGTTAFVSGGGVCPDPNGVNWCGFSDARVTTGWLSPYNGSEIVFMWNAAQGGPFALPYPYVHVAFFRESDRSLLGENFIFSNSYAFQYGAAGANVNGDAAGPITWGGGGNFANGNLWIWDDINSHVIQPLENYGEVTGSASPSLNRWGDYFTARRHSLWSASWNSVAFADTATNGPEPHWMWFGRERDLPPFPFNDYCYLPTPVTLVDGSPVFVVDNDSYAVFSGGDPAICAPVDRTLWYTFTAPSDGTISIETCGSIPDTVIAVWPGGTCPSGPALACNDDSCGLQSQILCLPVLSGQQYQVLIGVYDGTGYSIPQHYGSYTVNAFTFYSGEPAAITVSQCVAANTSGLTATAPSNAGSTYTWSLTGGTINTGQGTSSITFTSGGPATLMTLSLNETMASGCVTLDTKNIEVNFNDVLPSNPFYNFICTLARNAVTGGCGSGNFCPANPVLRSQMAVFLLRSEHGSAYVPPACTVPTFGDVPCSNPFSSWIYQLVTEGITGGCGGGNYCPNNAVLRNSMAVFLLVTEHGSAYTPPACSVATFTDVPCSNPFSSWIYQLVAEGITGGCTATLYCPTNPVSRASMSVFLVTTFSLP
jgi:hypothetical protein